VNAYEGKMQFWRKVMAAYCGLWDQCSVMSMGEVYLTFYSVHICFHIIISAEENLPMKFHY